MNEMNNIFTKEVIRNTFTTSNFVLLAAILSIMAFFAWAAINEKKKVESEPTIRERFEKQLGEAFVVDKDTLTIVSYSLYDAEFHLSNGLRVKASLVLDNNEKTNKTHKQ
jgi:hypothetical protein